MDITYMMARGFVYLAVVLDWFSRRVLSWRLSITMEAAFCVETLRTLSHATANRTSSTRTRAAVHRHDLPGVLIKNDRSAWMARALAGQVFVERLWRSVKYEEVYLRVRQRQRGRTSIGILQFTTGRTLE